MKSILLDKQTWHDANEERQQEWMSMINALLIKDVNRFTQGIQSLLILRREQKFELLIFKDNSFLKTSNESHYFLSSAPIEELEKKENYSSCLIQYNDLNDFMLEYIDIVRQLAKTDRIHRLETLDMAKKVVHDKAGRFLKKNCPELGMNLETARRLFSLLLAIKIDTTRILGVHGHRRIR